MVTTEPLCPSIPKEHSSNMGQGTAIGEDIAGRLNVSGLPAVFVKAEPPSANPSY